jgi:hypothetical protein
MDTLHSKFVRIPRLPMPSKIGMFYVRIALPGENCNLLALGHWWGGMKIPITAVMRVTVME